MKFHLLATVSLGFVFSTAALQDEAKKDLDRMQGTWNAVALVDNGKPASPERLKGEKFTVKGNHYELTGGEQSFRGTLKLDPVQNPKVIEATFLETDNQEKGRAHGVYAFEGERLKISWRQASGERPRDFKSTPGSHVRSMVFQKAN